MNFLSLQKPYDEPEPCNWKLWAFVIAGLLIIFGCYSCVENNQREADEAFARIEEQSNG